MLKSFLKVQLIRSGSEGLDNLGAGEVSNITGDAGLEPKTRLIVFRSGEGVFRSCGSGNYEIFFMV